MIELDQTIFLNMVSRALLKIRTTHHLFSRFIYSVHLISRPEHVLISGGNLHSTNRFCVIELGQTTFLNWRVKLLSHTIKL